MKTWYRGDAGGNVWEVVKDGMRRCWVYSRGGVWRSLRAIVCDMLEWCSPGGRSSGVVPPEAMLGWCGRNAGVEMISSEMTVK